LELIIKDKRLLKIKLKAEDIIMLILKKPVKSKTNTKLKPVLNKPTNKNLGIFSLIII